jgi:hypothetical protein
LKAQAVVHYWTVSQITNNTNNDSISVGDFFVKRGGDVLKATEIAKKPRRNMLTTLVFSFEGPGCCSLLDCFLFDFDLQFCVLLPFSLLSKVLQDKPYIEFVKWAQCVVCCHWVHLSYCVPEKVVRKDTEVVCPFNYKYAWREYLPVFYVILL